MTQKHTMLTTASKGIKYFGINLNKNATLVCWKLQNIVEKIKEYGNTSHVEGLEDLIIKMEIFCKLNQHNYNSHKNFNCLFYRNRQANPNGNARDAE